MTDELRVRLYNIRFGDAVLVTVPDNGTTRHILIDVGNVLSGKGGGGIDTVFKPIVEDIKAELAGKPLDLYVMTHEHMDHIQGLPFAKEKAGLELDVDFAWITASAAPDYYDTHPNAKKKKLEALDAYMQIAEYLQAAPDAKLEGLMLNNNPRSTADCVTYLRGLANKTTYVHRGAAIDGTHPFEEAKFEIWGPEEDTSSYYRSLQPLALGVNGGVGAEPTLVNPLPPSGVDAGAFYNLVDSRRTGLHDNLLAIDKAANNTSIVFSLEWRGWKLLFPGDAEQESWKMMDEQGVLEPIHLLKIAHHGSWNGTPQGALLDKILPEPPPDDRQRYAVVSTCLETYGGVPHTDTLDLLGLRAELHSTLDEIPDAGHFDIELPG